MGLFGLLKASLLAVSLLSRPDSQNLVFQLHSGIASERLSAIQQLSKLPPTPDISNVLVDALQDTDAKVVQATVVLWGKLAENHDTAYRKSMPRAGGKHTEAEVKAGIEKWQKWQERLVSELGRIVDSSDPVLAKAAARSLALMGDSVQDALPPIGRCGNGLEYVLWCKADVEFSKRTAARETLLRQLFLDRDVQVVYAAQQQLLAQSSKWLQSRYLAMARDTRRECRGLAACYGPESLAIALIGDSDSLVRDCAAFSLKDRERTLDMLAPHFAGGSEGLRLGVLSLVASSERETHSDLISMSLVDDRSSVRALGLNLAVNKHIQLSPQYIHACLQDPAAAVRRASVNALSRLESHTAQTQAVNLLMDPDEGVRDASLSYLKGNPSIEVIPAVIAMYRCYPNTEVYDLADLIKSVGPAADRQLRQMLRDPAAHIRKAGVMSANEVLGTGAREVLIALTRDPAPAVRGAAIVYLSYSSDARVPPIVVTMLSDKDKDVVLAATYAAENANSSGVLEALHHLESSEDDDICEWARRVLTRLARKARSGG